jgi:catechol 2,3-dioxygenase-like lactoylglutathione lyase family enzyme
MRLGQAMLFVRDLEAMTAFYRDVLGLRPVEATRRADWIEFETGGARLALHAIPDAIAREIEIAAPAAPRESQSCKLIFAVSDLDSERARLSAAGVTILQRPWGGWDALDPEGNVLGVCAANS